MLRGERQEEVNATLSWYERRLKMKLTPEVLHEISMSSGNRVVDKVAPRHDYIFNLEEPPLTIPGGAHLQPHDRAAGGGDRDPDQSHAPWVWAGAPTLTDAQRRQAVSAPLAPFAQSGGLERLKAAHKPRYGPSIDPLSKGQSTLERVRSDRARAEEDAR